VDGLGCARPQGRILGLFGLLGAGCNEAALAIGAGGPSRSRADRRGEVEIRRPPTPWRAASAWSRRTGGRA
jgi:hypothetical protein